MLRRRWREASSPRLLGLFLLIELLELLGMAFSLRQGEPWFAAVYGLLACCWCGASLVTLRNMRRRRWEQRAPGPADPPAGFVDEFGCPVPGQTLAERQQAEQRARTLLNEHLTRLQQATLAVYAYVDVTGSRGGRYRIWAEMDAYNVVERDDIGRELYRLCVRTTEPVPNADRLLAQKLLLESDEERFWRIANVQQGIQLPYAYRLQGRGVPPWERDKPTRGQRLGI